MPALTRIDEAIEGCLCRACLDRALDFPAPAFTPDSVLPVADAVLDAQLRAKIDAKTKPLGALGRLEALALQLGMIQRSLEPALVRPHLLVFAGDHGVAAEGVSAYPSSVTAQMVHNFLSGGAAANVFAAEAGLEFRVVDAGVAADFAPHPALIVRKRALGTRNLLVEPAMSNEDAAAALEAGAAIMLDLARAGCNVVALGEMGIANTTAAAALVARLADLPLETCVGRGTGVDDEGLARKRRVVAAALELHAGAHAPLDVLAALGGYEIAMLAGAIIGAARARMIVIVDGFIVGAAALAARAFAPAVLDYCVFAHRSAEQGHAALLEHLGARPLLDLDLRLGEGSAAALGFPLVRAAAAFLERMASFASAGVDGPADGGTAA
jgi:nicotinate-nucleotide--dimethylbenzimidazole phosphoribosyltransferase